MMTGAATNAGSFTRTCDRSLESYSLVLSQRMPVAGAMRTTFKGAKSIKFTILYILHKALHSNDVTAIRCCVCRE
jgi:hypothetical protein